MEKLFNNILVPVNFPEDGESVLKSVVEIAAPLQCPIHILYLVTKGSEAEEAAFERLKGLVSREVPFPLYIRVSRQEGPAGRSIIEYYRKNKIDLILLLRKKKRFPNLFSQSFPIDPDWLLKKIQCPVLTIHPGTALSLIKNIVLPIGDALPIRKLLVATYLAKQSQATIHLVSAAGVPGQPDGSAESLSGAFRLLSENTNLSVECRSLTGGNLAEVAWRYAQTIGAHLILVSPGKESLLSGSLWSLRSRSLFRVSGIPILAVP